jgi:hypothetical protein
LKQKTLAPRSATHRRHGKNINLFEDMQNYFQKRFNHFATFLIIQAIKPTIKPMIDTG